jgi:hypothetical protein
MVVVGLSLMFVVGLALQMGGYYALDTLGGSQNL